MKNIYIIFLTLLINISVSGQIFNPIQWSTKVEKISDSNYKLITQATIKEGWSLYSQDVPKAGPIPTTFTYDDNGGDLKIIGNTKEPKGKVKFTKLFSDEGMNIKSFANKAVFIQEITINKANQKIKTVNAFVEFIACTDEQCLPPKEIDLVFDISKAVLKKQNTTETTKSVNKEETKKDKRGLIAIFFIAFLSGFAALLTPCVFPMIPMTVSFFTKQSKNKAKGIKNAIIYGVSIIAIYVLLGTVVTWVFGADTLNALSTNVWFNIAFFLILVIFAISFLGAFEITLPSSWATKVDAKADKGGLIGIFFMALALAIVTFSCTGPIVGTLLVEAASKGGVAPIVGMLGFSSAIALPFALFAAFPGWLNSLPKSGGWLNTIKVVLGFLELALAFKFLSNADLVLQAHFLEREVFIAIWIAIFGALTLYLLGKIKLPHDSPEHHISVGRLCFGLVVGTFTLYMLPGLWGAPLNLISAFPPPQYYSESPYGVGYTKQNALIVGNKNTDPQLDKLVNLPEGAHIMPPHDIISFHDYDTGVAYAKKVGKPIMIDFTGHACVNCRKMEQNVWVQPKVLDILKNKVVLISLYVDDKRKLEEDEIVVSKLNQNKKLKYIGQKWSELQTIKYKANSQPFYVLMGHDEANLIAPASYTPDANEYFNWLEKGISNFKK
ncbi:thiol:disulfide interchange protein [Tenacibaculum piscium]|uniref:protein-disulfide reductase DsbD family protein n=1 Tax=Tenacibaculum piscium TaxID=1458515 RepID=UPI00187B6612|nr:cytochrome c biogenesis protein CcdA [Tenacibaculum piscium]MBE7684613.1 thiol:disulfide interchange protein [Tenacibaculum piscium]MBE7689233.1 thiol:disulfide interchange protein [Tenacibaculum piscium]